MRLTITGEIDLVTAAQLAEAAKPAERGGGVLVLDLSAVSFIDSVGLRTLIELSQRAEGDGRRLEIRGLQPQVRRVMEITGLLELLPVAG